MTSRSALGADCGMACCGARAGRSPCWRFASVRRAASTCPATGPVLLVSNHQSHLDPVLVGIACPRQMRFLARHSLFFWPLSWLIRSLGAVPIDRERGGLGGIKATLKLLARRRSGARVSGRHAHERRPTCNRSCPASAPWPDAAARRWCRWPSTARSPRCRAAAAFRTRARSDSRFARQFLLQNNNNSTTANSAVWSSRESPPAFSNGVSRLARSASPPPVDIAAFCRTPTIRFWKRLLVRGGEQLMNGHDGQPNRTAPIGADTVIPQFRRQSAARANAPPTGDVSPTRQNDGRGGRRRHACTRRFPGTVEASRRVELAFQVSGLLVKLPVKEGQKVAKGEVIAPASAGRIQGPAHSRCKASSIRPARRSAALRPANGPKNACGANRKCGQPRPGSPTPAPNSIASTTASSERGASPRAEYELIETAYRVAQEDHEAAVQFAREGHDRPRGRHRGPGGRGPRARRPRGRSQHPTRRTPRSRAPYDGVIAQRFVEEGQNVRPSSRSSGFRTSTRSTSPSTCRRRSWPPTSSAADIVRDARRVQRRARAAVPGRRSARSPRSPTRRRRRSRSAPPCKSPDGIRVLPGMTATVTVTYRRASILGDRILVPIAAVFKDADGRASRVGRRRRISKVAARPGEARRGHRRPRSKSSRASQPGDRIAVAGVTFLREGMKVRDLGDALGGGQP